MSQEASVSAAIVVRRALLGVAPRDVDEAQAALSALLDEIDRARAAETAPTGQVAEDMELLGGLLVTLPPFSSCYHALSRLAAKAQGYEAAEAEHTRLKRNTREAQDYASQEALARIKAESERDAAVADSAALRDRLQKAADGHSSRMFWDGVDALLRQPHPGTALLKQMQEQAESIHVLAGRLGARVAPDVAACLCYLTAPDRCNNCEDRELVERTGRLP